MAWIRLAWAPANVPVVLERDVFPGSRKQPGPGASRWLLSGKVSGPLVFERDVFPGLRKQPGPGGARWLSSGKVPGPLVFERDVFPGLRKQPGAGGARWPMALASGVFPGLRKQPGPGASRSPMALESCVLLALQRRPAPQWSRLVSVERLLAEWLKLWLVGAMPRERSVYEAKVERLSSGWRVEPAESVRWSRTESFGFPERRSAAA
jgi:hypothetical protein